MPVLFNGSSPLYPHRTIQVIAYQIGKIKAEENKKPPTPKVEAPSPFITPSSISSTPNIPLSPISIANPRSGRPRARFPDPRAGI
jgi:hypothetical protein